MMGSSLVLPTMFRSALIRNKEEDYATSKNDSNSSQCVEKCGCGDQCNSCLPLQQYEPQQKEQEKLHRQPQQQHPLPQERPREVTSDSENSDTIPPICQNDNTPTALTTDARAPLTEQVTVSRAASSTSMERIVSQYGGVVVAVDNGLCNSQGVSEVTNDERVRLGGHVGRTLASNDNWIVSLEWDENVRMSADYMTDNCGIGIIEADDEVVFLENDNISIMEDEDDADVWRSPKKRQRSLDRVVDEAFEEEYLHESEEIHYSTQRLTKIFDEEDTANHEEIYQNIIQKTIFTKDNLSSTELNEDDESPLDTIDGIDNSLVPIELLDKIPEIEYAKCTTMEDPRCDTMTLDEEPDQTPFFSVFLNTNQDVHPRKKPKYDVDCENVLLDEEMNKADSNIREQPLYLGAKSLSKSHDRFFGVSSAGTIQADRELLLTRLAYQGKEGLGRCPRHLSSQNLMMVTDHGPVSAHESEDPATVSTSREELATKDNQTVGEAGIGEAFLPNLQPSMPVIPALCKRFVFGGLPSYKFAVHAIDSDGTCSWIASTSLHPCASFIYIGRFCMLLFNRQMSFTNFN
jgi:hypothetical protein